MKKTWIAAIGIAMLMILIMGTTTWVFTSSPPIPKDFPLSQKWVTKINGDIEQISIVDNRIVIVRTITRIYALDAASGNMLWQHRTAWHFSYQPVLVAKGTLFLTDGKGVLALNQANGKVVWQQPVRFPSGAEVIDVTQGLVAVNDAPILAMYRTNDGSLVWDRWACREPTQGYFFDNYIVVPCFGLILIDAISGETIWEIKSEDSVDRIWKSAFADGVIYFSQDLENIVAYDVKNRKILWQTSLENDRSQAFHVSGDNLTVTMDHQVCILNRYDGQIVWCVDDLIKASNPVVFANAIFLFNGIRHGITAYDVEDGSQIGRLDLPAYNFITVDDRNLMVSSNDSLIFAFRNIIYAYEK